MSTPDSPRDDDPTHALDDFVRRLRPAPADSAMPDLSGLGARLHPPGAAPAASQPGERNAARPAGGRLRNGQAWRADDVQDVVDVPLAAARQAAAQWRADADAAAGDGLLQLQRTQPTRDARWLAQWQPGAWTAAVRWVIAGSTELVNTAQGPVVDSHPPQALLLLWPPQTAQAPVRDRWPVQLQLGDGNPAAAAATLLANLPAPADEAGATADGAAPGLWLDPQAEHTVDWALAAEVLLLHDSSLRPQQLAALRQFIDDERARCFARLNTAYAAAPAGGPVRRR